MPKYEVRVLEHYSKMLSYEIEAENEQEAENEIDRYISYDDNAKLSNMLTAEGDIEYDEFEIISSEEVVE